MTTTVAKKEPTRAEIREHVEKQIGAMAEKFEGVLPRHIPVERFSRAVLVHLARPELFGATANQTGRRAIAEACLKAATDGLLLDGREAALVPMKVGDDKIPSVMYMPMIAGLMKKARNSGEIIAIHCQVVHANDSCVIDFVSEGPPVKHRLDVKQERGAMIGVYAVAHLKDGWSDPQYLPKAEVDRIRARSRSASKGPWVTDYPEMARKTALRRLSKYLPASSDRDDDMTQVIERDESLDIDLTATEIAVTEGEPPPQITARRGRPPRGAGAAALKQAAEPEPEPTQEIIPPDEEEAYDAPEEAGEANEEPPPPDDDY